MISLRKEKQQLETVEKEETNITFGLIQKSQLFLQSLLHKIREEHNNDEVTINKSMDIQILEEMIQADQGIICLMIKYVSKYESLINRYETQSHFSKSPKKTMKLTQEWVDKLVFLNYLFKLTLFMYNFCFCS